MSEYNTKWALEVNGVSNIIVADQLVRAGDMTLEEFRTVAVQNASKMVRYIAAVQTALDAGRRPPFWHEVE